MQHDRPHLHSLLGVCDRAGRQGHGDMSDVYKRWQMAFENEQKRHRKAMRRIDGQYWLCLGIIILLTIYAVLI
jgi:hypothetical protein